MTHTLRGAKKGVGQTDKQSRAEQSICARGGAPPNRVGTYCWCPGFCHTERKCHHLSNNENWKQFPSARKRQAEREKEGTERGKQWGKERVQPELRSDFCPGSAAIVFITSLAQLHFTLKHLRLRVLLLLPRPFSYIYPLPPEPCYVYIQCGLISKLFPACAFSLAACLSGWSKQGHNECQDEPGLAAIERERKREGEQALKLRKFPFKHWQQFMCATRASSLHLLPPCPARTDSLAAALLQFPSGSTTSTTSVTVLPTQGLPYRHTHICVLLSVCVRFALWKFNRNYKQQDKWLLVAISLNEAGDRRKDQGLVPVFLELFSSSTCLQDVFLSCCCCCRRLVVKVAAGCRRRCRCRCVCFELLPSFDIVFILVDCALHFA